jgi:hypothetical protein
MRLPNSFFAFASELAKTLVRKMAAKWSQKALEKWVFKILREKSVGREPRK